VHGTGLPAPALRESGPLPAGVSFTDHHDGTGVLSGTPAAAEGGVYPVLISASNGVGPSASQTFTLTVDQAPAFVAGGQADLYVGESGAFDVHATGYPDPSVTESGAIPGVTFTDGGGGTGILSGAPSAQAAGVHTLTFTASNGVGPPAAMALPVTVRIPHPLEITSPPVAFCLAGRPCNLTVTTSGSPVPALSIRGDLPPGMTFADDHDGTATISGTPTTPRWFGYSVDVTASDGVQPSRTRRLWILVFPSGCSRGAGRPRGC